MTVYLTYFITSLLSGLFIKRRLATFVFLFLTYLFIGFRLETGFDFQVYQEIYDGLGANFSQAMIVFYHLIHGQEIGFLALIGASAQVLPSYEVFQSLITLLLLWSTVFLARTVGVEKTAMVVAIAMTYLLWSVGFSTLRQSVAISLFNFGLAHMLRKQSVRGAAFFIAAPFFQLSSIIYIMGFVATLFLYRSGNPPRLRSLFFIVMFVAVGGPIALDLAGSLFSATANKLEYYRSFQFGFGLLEIVFLMFFGTAALLCSKSMLRSGTDNDRATKLRQLTFVLACIGIGSTFFVIVRDRVSYEVFILVSICLMTQGVRYHWYFVSFFVLFGLFITIINISPYPMRIVFMPYQNVITHFVFDQGSTGAERNAVFMEEFDEIVRR